MSKKQQILETSIQLFAKQGIEATSIQHITRSTGISKGAFYLAFSSKEELIKEIIDTFMQQFVADIDQVVTSLLPASEKLHNYFAAHLDLLVKHADFAKMYAQEQMHSINEDILSDLIVYDTLIDRSLLSLFHELYPTHTTDQSADLLVAVKGLVRIYSQLILFHPYPHDTKQILASLVEKTDILAKHSTTCYITEEMMRIPVQTDKLATTPAHLKAVVSELLSDEHPALIQESFAILVDELGQESSRQALLQGLAANFMTYTPTKWLAYLVKHYTHKKDA